MKRKFFALFAVLLVLMLATCSSDEGGDTGEGKTMVSLTINVGDGSASRAVNQNLAQTANRIDYYEVAFKDPVDGVVYRYAWASSELNPTISVPTGSYSNDTDAVLFAGINDNGTKILLAVGNFTAAAPASGPSTGTTIDSQTKTVTFALTALANNVNTTNTSTFKIIGPTNASGTNYTTTYPIPEAEIDSVNYPVFDLPPKSYSYTPDSPFSTSGSATNIVGHYSFTIPHSSAVVLADEWNFSSTAQPFTDSQSNTTQGVTVSITPKSPLYSSSTPTAVNGHFYFLIGVPSGSGNNGLSKISISVPVYALNDDDPTPVFSNSHIGEWRIQGGINNSDLDGGSASDGGAVLLAVGGEAFRDPSATPYTPEIVDVGVGKTGP